LNEWALAAPEVQTLYRDFLPAGFVAAAPVERVRKEEVWAIGSFGFADFGFLISRLPFC
jgi:hypothetical protein